ncbi:MAG: hypothetical protein WAO74_12570 [Polaribacter sp.]|uniref:hypothetical protein n=1 Tax=Polaribacter sp. TaxID=1920175 RepID=UPI003BAEDE85
MKSFKTLVFCICLLFINQSVNAQFWKKIKKKIENKVENKIDKEADKTIDGVLDGKKNEDEKEEDIIDEPLNSYGSASINHSVKYGTVQVSELTKTKVYKQGSTFRFNGNWITSSIDVFDGYNLKIFDIESIDALNEKKTFKIPEEATIKLGYDPIQQTKKESSGEGQTYDLESGFVTVAFNKDENVSISFNGSATLTKAEKKATGIDEYNYIKTPVTLTGMINTTNPEYILTKEFKQKEKKKQDTNLTESDKNYLKEKLSPTVNIPSSFSFDKSIELEFTDDRGESYPMEFLLGNYPDIWGMSVASKEMQGQGQVIMVMTPKSSTAFMDVAGMKMKKSTSLEEMGDSYKMTDKLPEDGDFEYKKTGNTKTILGYTCEEYRVDYNYTNAKGSAVFWVSKDFPIQNKQLPMLGMKMNNPYFDGFVLELNTTNQGKNHVIKVTNVSDKNVSIKTSEYKKMGF